MSNIANSVIAVSMSADAFAASISKGMVVRAPSLRYALRIGFIFGAVEAITPLIGWLIGMMASDVIGAVDHWIAFAILALIGIKMMYESTHNTEETPRPSPTLRILILTAIGTSMDAMAVGMTFALLDVNIWFMAALIGFATFAMSTIGVMAGHYIVFSKLIY
jgi:putative Mn2+ efflux pump MntP